MHTTSDLYNYQILLIYFERHWSNGLHNQDNKGVTLTIFACDISSRPILDIYQIRLNYSNRNRSHEEHEVLFPKLRRQMIKKTRELELPSLYTTYLLDLSNIPTIYHQTILNGMGVVKHTIFHYLMSQGETK